MAQLKTYFKDPTLLRYLDAIVNHAIDDGGNLTLPTKGIPLRSSLSNFFGALYLKALDEAFSNREGIFYARYQDDIILLFRNERQFQRGKRRMYRVLDSLTLTLSHSKSKMGAISLHDIDKPDAPWLPHWGVDNDTQDTKEDIHESAFNDAIQEIHGLLALSAQAKSKKATSPQNSELNETTRRLLLKTTTKHPQQLHPEALAVEPPPTRPEPPEPSTAPLMPTVRTRYAEYCEDSPHTPILGRSARVSDIVSPYHVKNAERVLQTALQNLTHREQHPSDFHYLGGETDLSQNSVGKIQATLRPHPRSCRRALAKFETRVANADSSATIRVYLDRWAAWWAHALGLSWESVMLEWLRFVAGKNARAVRFAVELLCARANATLQKGLI